MQAKFLYTSILIIMCAAQLTGQLIIDPGSDVTICFGESTMLGGSPTASGSTGFYQYLWTSTDASFTSIESNPVVSPNSTATYYIEVISSDSTVGYDSVTVSTFQIPNFSITAPTGECAGTSVIIGATDLVGYSYLWEVPPTATISNLDSNLLSFIPTSSLFSGTYQVTITNSSNNCDTILTQDVTFYDLPSVTLTSDPVCIGDLLAINSTVTAGSAASGTYLWADGRTIDDIPIFGASLSDAGLYSLTYTDANSCTATVSITAVVNTPPIADAGSDVTLCAGESYTLMGSGSSSDLTYLWAGPNSFSSNDSTPSLLSLGADDFGTYSLTVTNQEGCSDVDTMFLSRRTEGINFNIPNSTIFNISDANATLGAELDSSTTAGVFTFSGSGVIESNGTYLFSPMIAEAGKDTLTCTFTANDGCISTVKRVFTTVDPSDVFIGLSNDTTYCSDASIDEFLIDVTNIPNGDVQLIGLSPSFDFNCIPSFFSYRSKFLQETYSYYDVRVYSVDSGTRTLQNGVLTYVLQSGQRRYTLNLSALLPGNYVLENAIVRTISTSTITVCNNPDLTGPGTSSPNVLSTDTLGNGEISFTIGYQPDPIIASQTFCASDNSMTVSIQNTSEVAFVNWYQDSTTSAFQMGGTELELVSAGIVTPNDAATDTSIVIYAKNNDCGQYFIPVQIEILGVPQLQFLGLDSSYCNYETNIDFTANLVPGSFIGANILANTAGDSATFLISSAVNNPIGFIDIVSYTYADTNGCSTTLGLEVVVNDRPTVEILGLPATGEVCSNENEITFSVSPASGSFLSSGNYGVINDSTYSPLAAYNALGTTSTSFVDTILYQYIDPVNGCGDTTFSAQLVVHNPTVPTIIGLDSSYCNNNTGVLITGFPSANLSGTNGEFIIDSLQVGLGSGYQFEPGSYNSIDIPVTYTYTDDNNCTERATETVSIFSTPTAAFNWTSGFCESQPLIIEDASSISNNVRNDSIVNWSWIYSGRTSDSSIAYLANPTPGPFNVELTVTTNNGCSDVVGIVNSFIVGSDPIVDFTYSGLCSNGLTTFAPSDNLAANFNLTAFDTLSAIRWYFGDGTTSLDSIATHQFLPGIHDVSLVFETTQNCKDSVFQRIAVAPYVDTYPYTADFNSSNDDWYTLAEAPFDTSVWELGIASGTVISTSAGNQVWATGLANDYSENQSAWVYGPCFNLMALERPMLSLDIYANTQENFDGVVLEYSLDDGLTWSPLGDVGTGLEWFNSEAIASRPGDQNTGFTAIGWSGDTNGWLNARHRLDDFKTETSFRIRLAFASDGSNPLSTDLNGFAFDNVFVGERERVVLVEHFSNINNNSLNWIEPHLYGLVYGTNSQDALLIQSHINSEGTDFINQLNSADPAALSFYYGVLNSGRALLNGKVVSDGTTETLLYQQNTLDLEMLQDPLFTILQDTLYTTSNTIYFEGRIRANEAILTSEEIAAYITVVEDSVSIDGTPNGRLMFGVLRKIMGDASGITFTQTWASGEEQTISGTWTFDPTLGIDPEHLEVVVHVQNRPTKEVYQAYTSRAPLSLFYLDVPEIETSKTLVFKLFPNPAKGEAEVLFAEYLKTDVNWTLTDLYGRIVKEDVVRAGSNGFKIIREQKMAAGLYFLNLMDAQKSVGSRKIVFLD